LSFEDLQIFSRAGFGSGFTTEKGNRKPELPFELESAFFDNKSGIEATVFSICHSRRRSGKYSVRIFER